ETLKSFTLWAAYAAFEEDQKGSLEKGKLADFIVIDRDIMTCPPADIPATRVLRTVIGGETVFVADEE
ncbi:MAG TPA: amidohydrolase, partial [Phycisphaerales bacterium]|nr:amidohydrolase [Phycisphaerales bacterium]